MTVLETGPSPRDLPPREAPSDSAKNSENTVCVELAVEGVSCPACMAKIEKGVGKLAGVANARYNMTTHRLRVEGDPALLQADTIITTIDDLGYKASPFTLDKVEADAEAHGRFLLRAMAVAGFAAANIMMLSVPVWSGNVSGIEPETRALFHWVSAIIALPAVAYAGQPFFQSAFAALRKRRLNMDVPISLAVILALIMSVIQTATGAEDAYFDSAVMLLFFLLIGRYLDHRSRQRTRDLGQNMLALQRPTVTRLMPDGETRTVPAADIRPGDRVLVSPGSRVGIDGVVVAGNSQLDASLITGETEPQTIQEGDRVYAGTLNLTGTLTVEAKSAGTDTLLAEISALMDKATEKRGAYVRLADRAASLYAPVVHLLALFTFLGWLALGHGWQTSLLTAIAVLIITCPCALGLAVPVVQVVATGALFRAGVLVNAGDALERLALADTVVFDKTGTLTEPEPTIVNRQDWDENDLALAARLALSSHHVLAKALAHALKARDPINGAKETPGQGVMAVHEGEILRLGARRFCDPDAPDTNDATAGKTYSEIWFRRGDGPTRPILFDQALKADAKQTVATLKDMGLAVLIFSGDREGPVAQVAQELGISRHMAHMSPKDKIEAIEALKGEGRTVLMVGDGLNDAAALQAAHVSAAPASALDITQAAADVILVGTRLAPLVTALRVGRKARRLMLENFFFAGLYNMVAIPLAVLGYVTPLLAALFMSGSSIVVTLNALRARLGVGGREQ